MGQRYDGKNGYLIHTEKGLFWYGYNGFNGELLGKYTGEEAFDIFKSGDTDAHSVFNKVN